MKSASLNHENPIISGKNERIIAIKITVLPVKPRFSINHADTSKPEIPPEPSGKASSPICMEKSVDDERSRTKKDTTLIAINVLSILLTASLIKVIPADRKSRGRK